MRVIPLAAESLGVRSMATFVEVAGTGILLDPGASLASTRFNLPPAEEEWEALRRGNDRISAWAVRSQLVFVSHYHEDHFRSDPATYAGRTVLAKDPRRMVQGRQLQRATELWRALGGQARVEAADGWERRDGAVRLEVSPPLAHGLEGTGLGYVVALTVTDLAERERFVFGSDVQGPLSPVGAAYLIRQRPTLLYLAGPPSYVEHEVGAAVIDRGIEHLLHVIDATGCRVILDHHALRDWRWRARFERLWDSGRVVTAAGWLGLPETPLEAHRRDLWTQARKPVAKAGSGGGIMASRPSRRTIRRHVAKGG